MTGGARWLTCVALIAASCAGACSEHRGVDFGVATKLPSPAPAGSAQPQLSKNRLDEPVLSWVEPTQTGHRLMTATLSGTRWSTPRQVATGSGWFINWADFPSVIPIDANLWVAHWLVSRENASLAYDIRIAVSGDGGDSWSEGRSPHALTNPAEYGFVSLFPLGESFAAVWLDGRNTAGGHGKGAMSLRFANFDSSGAITSEAQIDEMTCDCCQTDVAITPSGPMLAYRDRTAEEIRDISVSRYVNGSWMQPQTLGPDGWHIDGCPVNGPAIAAAGNHVGIAWFSAAGGHGHINYVRSDDLGRSFSAPIVIEDEAAIGRVDVVMRPGGRAHVSYVAGDRLDGNAELRLRDIDAHGQPQQTRVIGSLSRERASGFPRMLESDDRLVFAWTDVSAGKSVATALLHMPPD